MRERSNTLTTTMIILKEYAIRLKPFVSRKVKVPSEVVADDKIRLNDFYDTEIEVYEVGENTYEKKGEKNNFWGVLCVIFSHMK